MKRYLLLGAIFALGLTIASCREGRSIQAEQNIKVENQSIELKSDRPFSYEDYATVLKTYVNDNGLVDYVGLQANRQLLDRFNQSLAAVTPDTYASWSEPEQIAFWMNAYNSLTLQSIIDTEPIVKSIRKIPGVWNKRKFAIAGDTKTLDNIEHDTLRKDFNEPRLHFALVCAAISCPPLLDEPYLAETLDEQLDERVNKFINSSHGFKIDRQKNKVHLSSIFKWYGQDWQPAYDVEDKFAGNDKQKAVLNFLSEYLNADDLQYLELGDYKVSHLDYDWSLNRQSAAN